MEQHVSPSRFLVLALLLAAVIFASSFAIGRALRAEPESTPPSPPRAVDAPTPELVDLGPPAELPDLRPLPNASSEP